MKKWFEGLDSEDKLPGVVFNYEREKDLKRIDHLEKELLEEREYKHTDPRRKEPTISVPVVNDLGEPVIELSSPRFLYPGPKRKDITLTEAFRALEEMCDVQVTYQETKATGEVVIYEREDEQNTQETN